MKVKVFTLGGVQEEADEIQKWLDEVQPSEIIAMSQSCNSVDTIKLTIVYRP